jgi:single-stranded DNA-binding protein
VFQQFTGIGRVTGTPEIKEWCPEKFLARIRVCCNNYYRGPEGKFVKKDLFITVQLWNSSAAQGAPSRFPTGTLVFFQGPLEIKPYQAKTGQWRKNVAVNIGSVGTRLFPFVKSKNALPDEHLFDETPPDESELFVDGAEPTLARDTELNDDRDGEEDFV